MPTVPAIKMVNVDGVDYAVEAMSDACQSLVSIYSEWNQKEAEATDHLTMIQAAKETLSRKIINQVRQEQNAAKESAQRSSLTEDVLQDAAESDVVADTDTLSTVSAVYEDEEPKNEGKV